MTNTPSDAEIEKLAAEHLKAFSKFPMGGQVWFEGEVEFARAVLAKWGTPQPTHAQAGVVPLIADEICDAWEFVTGHQIQFGPSNEGRAMFISTDEVIDFARAIEQAHGITQKGAAMLSDLEIEKAQRYLRIWQSLTSLPMVSHHVDFARAIEAEVRQQDDALIQQLVDALDDLTGAGEEAWSEERPCVRIGKEAITAGRARLGVK